jgi:hypothetical protein
VKALLMSITSRAGRSPNPTLPPIAGAAVSLIEEPPGEMGVC